MESSDICNIIHGVCLTLSGKTDLSKYNYRGSHKTKTVHTFTTLVETPHDAILLGCAIFWAKKYYIEVEKETAKEMLDEWRYRVNKPSSVLHDVIIERPEDIVSLIKETSVGSHLLTSTIRGDISPVTFCYIDSLTDCTSKWNSTYWKIQKEKFIRTKKAIDIPRQNVVKLSRYLTNKFKGEINE